MPSTPNAPPEDDLVVRGLLGLLRRGEATAEAIEKELGRNLVSGCSSCRERNGSAVIALLRPPGRPGTGWLGLATEPGSTSRSQKGREPEGDDLFAALAVERLQGLSRDDRLALAQRQHYDFRGVALARAFLAQALASLPGDPNDSECWAELAHLATGFDGRHYCTDDQEQAVLALRIELYQANALRCRGELDQADLDLEKAIFDARQLGVSDAWFWAEAKSFGTAIKRDRREFDEALQQAHFAAVVWEHLGEQARGVRTRAQIASIHGQRGEFSAALAAIQDAVRLVVELPEPALTFDVKHSEVFLLARAGRVSEAATAYSRLAPDYAQYPRKENYRAWAWGLIASGLDQHTEAEASFRSARLGFLAAQNPYDAALVTLDWSLFLLDQNRPEGVLPLAMSMGQAFEALGVARETLASWAIFQAAAERRELTRAVAESMVRTLGEERAGAKPGR